MKSKRQKTQSKSQRRHKRKPSVRRILDELTAFVRQMLQHPEFRIRRPNISPEVLEIIAEDHSTDVVSVETDPIVTPVMSDKAIAETATGFWYLKTRYFKRDWGNEDTSDDDPRVRRAIARLNKSLDALKESGVEIQDPTNKRYQPGSEGTMRPLQFDPTPGLDHQRVTETVSPIIFLNGRIIQRGEVFVAVPEEKRPSPTGPLASNLPAGSDAEIRPNDEEEPSSRATTSVSPMSNSPTSHSQSDATGSIVSPPIEGTAVPEE